MIIVLFHIFYLLGKLVLRRYGAKMEQEQVAGDGDIDCAPSPKEVKERTNLLRRHSSGDLFGESKSSIIKFSPPAYIQRYQTVDKVLTNKIYGGKLKKIVDFGCSELGFVLYVKNMKGVLEALFVDIDRNTLDAYKERARPLNADYLHKRPNPLLLRVMEGSVTDNDKSLENCDAVVCIELVEHLYPEPLTNLPYNIFGFIRPKVAIITTPNADFNVLFENMSGFRHPDHKFEWTRRQFQDWAHNIVARFPEYDVTFHGICDGPPGTEHLGSCSQMAIFHKICDLNIENVPGVDGLFKVVADYDYPYHQDNRSDEEKIRDEAVYNINKLSASEEKYAEEIPLETLLHFMEIACISINNLKEVLQNANWAIEEREEGPVVLVPPVSGFSDNSFDEDNFLDYGYPPGHVEWDEEPGLANYSFDHSTINDINVVDEEEWDNEPVINNLLPTENISTDINNISHDIDERDSSVLSTYPDDENWGDVVVQNDSAEIANSAVDNSILLSSYSETKGSENSEIIRNPGLETEMSSISIDSSIADINTVSASLQLSQKSESENTFINSTNFSTSKDTSICSMFLEPSQISKDIYLEDLSDLPLDCTVTNSSLKTNKKLKLNNSESLSNANEHIFEEPQCTSSPQVSSSYVSKKRKLSEQRVNQSNSNSVSSSNNEELRLDKNESVIAESDLSQEIIRHTGTIPKSLSMKISDAKINVHTETKLERISPDTPKSPLNSCWSPEIMDSGYPNSNSPHDLSPQYDLSSIAQDFTSDLDSPSIADEPRVDFFNLAQAQNRDFANNNLDDEGNNMEAEENQHINNLEPLINVIENDMENENDIYVVPNGFPIWLLRILQRLEADGVGRNLAIA